MKTADLITQGNDMTDQAKWAELAETLKMIEDHKIAIWSATDGGWVAASQHPKPFRHVKGQSVAEDVRMFMSNAPSE